MAMMVRPAEPMRPTPPVRAQVRHRPAGAGAIGVRAAFIGLLAAVACASGRGDLDRAAIAPDELLAGASLGVLAGSAAPVVAEDGVLALSAEMREFLDRHVDRRGGAALKLHQLVSAIIDTSAFGLEYDDTTRTAAETFRVRRGNCLSFSNMFVAMAREVGLDVQFQEVDIPPDWTLDHDTFVLNRHVNVYVDLDRGGTRAVDFNIGDFKTSYEMRKISDTRARAHYYNNLGVERMQKGDTASALACFRSAVADNDRGFSAAWTNLGTLYQRNGRAAHAEACYLQALKASARDLVAMSNLARLYELQGDRGRAAAYQKRVVYHRMRNPYYRYSLAREALASGDLDVAIGHLRYAIRRRPKEDEFCLQLGLAYLQQGDQRAAQRWLARAREVAATDALKRRYSMKIDTLLRQGAGNHH